MANWYVNFPYLEKHGIFIYEMFQYLSLNFFCTLQKEVYPYFVAKFYSNLHLSYKTVSHSPLRSMILLTAGSFSELKHHPMSKFKRIPVSFEAYLFMMESIEPIRREKISLSMLPLKITLIYKILIICLHLNSSSTNDVSHYEA